MKIAIFGAGQGGLMAAAWRSSHLSLLCYIDNKERLWHTCIDQVPVLPLDEALLEKPDEIWIGVLNRDAEQSIHEQIRAAGFDKPIKTLSEVRERLDFRLASLRLYAEEIKKRGVAGAVAELGVYRGDFASEINRLFPDRKLYLFDTFEGFAASDLEKEKEFGFSRAKPADFSDTSESLVLSKMPSPEKVILRKGYFPETAFGIDESFAFVSLDPDLYEPTLAGLRYFYPRLQKGGCIFIHDYNSKQFAGVREAVDLYTKEQGLFVFPLVDLHGTAVLVKA